MKVILLKDCDNKMIDSLVKLDKEMIDKYGKSFSEEIWTEEHFKYELPFKNLKSFCIKDQIGVVVAYCIISIKNKAQPYIHRFVAKKGYSDILMQEILKRNNNIFLVVSSINFPAIQFYTKYGFKTVFNKDQQRGFYPDGIPKMISNGFYHDDTKFLMIKDEK